MLRVLRSAFLVGPGQTGYTPCHPGVSNETTERGMAFARAASLSEIPAGSIKEVQVGGKTVALANVGGLFFAMDNTCLHRGGPLGEGQLEGNVVTCPWH